jgi:hypothetical protein
MSCRRWPRGPLQLRFRVSRYLWVPKTYAIRRYSWITPRRGRAAGRGSVVQVGDAIGQRAKRRGRVQGTVRPVGVVEVLVLAQDGHQVALVPDQGPVQQLTPAGADPAFHDGVHSRRLNSRAATARQSRPAAAEDVAMQSRRGCARAGSPPRPRGSSTGAAGSPRSPRGESRPRAARAARASRRNCRQAVSVRRCGAGGVFRALRIRRLARRADPVAKLQQLTLDPLAAQPLFSAAIRSISGQPQRWSAAIPYGADRRRKAGNTQLYLRHEDRDLRS